MNEAPVAIKSDLDALVQLFDANQVLAQRETELEAAKTARNDARAARDALLVRIGSYTADRRAEIARMSLFDDEFKRNPRPTWIDGTTGGPGTDPPGAPA